MAKVTNIEKDSQVKTSGDIDDFNLDIGFVEAVFDVLFAIDGHYSLDELHRGSVCSLLAEAEDRLERAKNYTNNLEGSFKKADQVEVA